MWKAIKDYEGLYEVSDEGQVRSLDRVIEYTNRWGKQSKQLHKGQIISQHDNGKGYLNVNLWKDNKGKTLYVHRLVAQAFIENPNNLPQVNHRDENKQNNNVSNLEWCSNDYNNNYGTKRKRQGETLLDNGKTSNRIIQYDLEGNEISRYRSMREAERENHLANGAISAYFKRGFKHAGGYRWEKIPKEVKEC